MAKLNWAVAPFARKGLVEFYSPWKREGRCAHSTRLRNHKSKWYRFETAREVVAEGRRRRKRVRERAGNITGEGSLLLEGCYERCVQLTVASSVHAVPLVTGVVNARGVPTYLRQFLFMADPPSPQGEEGTQFLANWYRTIILLH